MQVRRARDSKMPLALEGAQDEEQGDRVRAAGQGDQDSRAWLPQRLALNRPPDGFEQQHWRFGNLEMWRFGNLEPGGRFPDSPISRFPDRKNGAGAGT